MTNQSLSLPHFNPNPLNLGHISNHPSLYVPVPKLTNPLANLIDCTFEVFSSSNLANDTTYVNSIRYDPRHHKILAATLMLQPGGFRIKILLTCNKIFDKPLSHFITLNLLCPKPLSSSSFPFKISSPPFSPYKLINAAKRFNSVFIWSRTASEAASSQPESGGRPPSAVVNFGVIVLWFILSANQFFVYLSQRSFSSAFLLP